MDPESSIPPLPIEVWGQIFQHIDNPYDLMEVRKVCKKWNEEINRVLPYANWKQLCLSEIRAFSLSSIIAVVQPWLPKNDYRSINDQQFWQQVYFHYKKWMNIEELSLKVLTPESDILFLLEHITCFDTWESWIIFGTDHRRIYVFDNFDYKKPHCILKYNDNIKEVKFWYSDNNCLLFVILSRARFATICNIVDQKAIFSLKPVHKLCVGTSNNLYITDNACLMKMQSTLQTVSVKSTINMNFNVGEDVVAMASRESKIFIVTRFGMKLRLFTVEDELFTKPEPVLQVKTIFAIPHLPLCISGTNVYVTLNRTVICIRHTTVSIYAGRTDYWVIHDKIMYLDAKVTSLVVHGSHLILGSSNGILCIYYVEGISEFLDPNLFRKAPIKMFSLDILPIIDIQVTHLNGEINIIAFNREKIFILAF